VAAVQRPHQAIWQAAPTRTLVCLALHHIALDRGMPAMYTHRRWMRTDKEAAASRGERVWWWRPCGLSNMSCVSATRGKCCCRCVVGNKIMLPQDQLRHTAGLKQNRPHSHFSGGTRVDSGWIGQCGHSLATQTPRNVRPTRQK
jgi:hypothetical protein